MVTNIQKRDGRVVDYDIIKIKSAINKAMKADGIENEQESLRLARIVEEKVNEKFTNGIPQVEDIQDIVEKVLMEEMYAEVAKKYITYRLQRSKNREMNTELIKILDELTNTSAVDSDIKRENANIDGDTAMGTMLRYGSESAKYYYQKFLLKDEESEAHRKGDIHIHDFDFYNLTTTCCQIDLNKLFHNGFSTGHGFLREPNDISSYAALACIAIQSNQNDQHGGQSIPNFDYGLATGVKKTYKKLYQKNFIKASSLICPELDEEKIKEIFRMLESLSLEPTLKNSEKYDVQERDIFKTLIKEENYNKIKEFTINNSYKETDRATYQAMEALVHNLNTMHSRAGAQVPFSSINYGTDTSEEGRMVIKNVLLATESGLGDGETPIFPIHIFKVKEGVNFNEGDPNYDLFKLACKVSAKRLFPNFSFIDAPFNMQYYKEGKPETEVAYMGCRTRVIGNNFDKSREITFGRGNLSFTSINLPRLALESNKNIDLFFEKLEEKLILVKEQLYNRFKIQCRKKVKNFPFLMGQGVWIDSEKLSMNDSVEEVLKHGTLSIGFIGLAETLIALIGKHHGESEEAQELGLKIVKFMRDFTDNASKESGLNYTLLATPAEGLSGRFIKFDKKKYGEIENITKKEYYTNSFHIPVSYPISAYKKIELEAPYHALTNAGHISYIELDGDTTKNTEAFESVIRYMKECGIGYGAINHPVDRDPVCGYNGIIGDTCPKCGRKECDSDIKFERIRRITGYLVGTLDRFNNGKRAEERDRIKHNVKN
ncbi:MAG: anaerobic ribonucleoside triphosphate reductase [Clostridia bacterium]|nr:anaerobic ribonucleoside triphosphate reductase [Clostridia bacterium]